MICLVNLQFQLPLIWFIFRFRNTVGFWKGGNGFGVWGRKKREVEELEELEKIDLT